MRLRRRFILSEGVSFSSVLFSVLAIGSAGLARGERKLISTGGGGSGAAFDLQKRRQKNQGKIIKIKQSDAQPIHYSITQTGRLRLQPKNAKTFFDYNHACKHSSYITIAIGLCATWAIHLVVLFFLGLTTSVSTATSSRGPLSYNKRKNL